MIQKNLLGLFICVLSMALLLTGCENEQQVQEPSSSSSENQSISAPLMLIRMTSDAQSVIFQLNNSRAAQSLYEQLPLVVETEDYAGSEKIFYPPEKLDVFNAPLAEGPGGTLAYYEPWGNVAIFYGECGEAVGLYELGWAISGAEKIENLNGEMRIEKAAGGSAENAEDSQAQISSTPSTRTPSGQATGNAAGEKAMTKMYVQVGHRTFIATLESNAAADALVEMMENTPLTIQMQDYAGFEKVGPLGTNLPADDSQTATHTGDIVLYQGNQVVMFYGSNSWSYTRLGKIDDLSGWEEALGSGGVSVTLSLGR